MSSSGRLLIFLNLAVWHGVAIVGVMIHNVPVSMVGTGLVLFMGRWLQDLSDDDEDLDDEPSDGNTSET